MPTPDDVRRYIAAGLECSVLEVSGDGQHFEALIVSSLFEGKRLVQRHRELGARLEALEVLQQRIEELAASLAARDRLHLSVETVEDFFANMNDPAATEIAHRAAEQCGFDIITPAQGLRGGEDFGLFSERFPCCMVLLGAGENAHPIHNPHYDFNDATLVPAATYWARLVERYLA